MNETDAIINAFLHEREQEIIDTVENIVNIDSGSRNIEGTTAVATVLSERLAQYGIEVQLQVKEQGLYLLRILIKTTRAKLPSAS